MERRGAEIHTSETEASAGSKEGVVRWVLGIGLLLVIVALSLTWIVPALTMDERGEEGDMTGRVLAEESGDDTTDSIVSDRMETVDTTTPSTAAQTPETPQQPATAN